MKLENKMLYCKNCAREGFKKYKGLCLGCAQWEGIRVKLKNKMSLIGYFIPGSKTVQGSREMVEKWQHGFNWLIPYSQCGTNDEPKIRVPHLERTKRKSDMGKARLLKITVEEIKYLPKRKP